MIEDAASSIIGFLLLFFDMETQNYPMEEFLKLPNWVVFIESQIQD